MDTPRQIVDARVCDGILPAILDRKVEGVDEFLAVQSGLKGPGTRGWWDNLLPTLPDDKRESLMQAAHSRDISHRTISVVLNKWGFKVTPAMVGHWRRTHVR